MFRSGVLEDSVSSKQISIAADAVLALCVSGRYVAMSGYIASVGRYNSVKFRRSEG